MQNWSNGGWTLQDQFSNSSISERFKARTFSMHYISDGLWADRSLCPWHVSMTQDGSRIALHLRFHNPEQNTETWWILWPLGNFTVMLYPNSVAQIDSPKLIPAQQSVAASVQFHLLRARERDDPNNSPIFPPSSLSPTHSLHIWGHTKSKSTKFFAKMA